MKRSFKKDIGALSVIFDFTSEFVDSNHIDESTEFAMNLAIEELFTNIVKYGSKGDEVISIHLDTRGHELVIKITDFDVEPFDITKVNKVDVTAPLDERRIGGLGLLIVHGLFDKVSYEYKNRNAYITLRKGLEDLNV
jgi:anti-sigma regulatory factor (Ser/Thr protein kinase)